MILLAVTLIGYAGGCRLPGMEGPASRSLVSSRQLSQQGVAALERRQWDRADELLAQAVRACPSNPDARRSFAEARWNRGFRAEALAELEAAQRLAPDDAGIRARIAEMRLELGQKAAALEAAEQAVDLDPRLPAAWAVRAKVMRAAGNLAEALGNYQRALACSPEDRRLPCEIAAVYLEMNRPQQALATVHGLADRFSPSDEPQEVLYWQGLSYLALHQYDEAVESLSAAATREEPSADILFRLAEAQWGAGRAAQAAATAEQVLALEPKHEPARMLLEDARLAQQPDAAQRR